jgi:hypothetical protein
VACWRTRPGELRAAFLRVALVAFARPAASETALRLRLLGEDGAEVRVTRALVLPVAWGSSDVVELPARDATITVPLDAAWLRDRFGRVDDMEAAYLYVEAGGWVPIRSDGFRLVFPRHAPIIVGAGETADVDLRLRRPGERTLRLVDEEGRPVGRVGVNAFTFWSRSNHCGRIVTTLPMGGGRTDA